MQYGFAFSGDKASLKSWAMSNAGKVNDLSKDRHCSLLYTAARGGHFAIVKMLVEDFLADINVRNGENGGMSTPLHGAAFGGHHEVVAYLLSKGAKQKKNGYGETPLDNAKEPAEGVSASDAKKCIKALQAPADPVPATTVPATTTSPVKQQAQEKKQETPKAAPPPPAEVATTERPAFSASQLLKKGIAELRQLCSKFGLSATGDKSKLIERLSSKDQEKKDAAVTPVKPEGAVKSKPTEEAEGDAPPAKKQKTETATGSATTLATPASVEEGAGSLDPAWIEKLKGATVVQKEVEKDTEEFWALEEKVMACCQGRNEDYVQNRIKKKKKPLTFIVKRAWKVTNPVLDKAFAEKKKELAANYGEPCTRVRVAFHGTKEANINSILTTSLLRFKHPLNPCKEQADDGYFGTNRKGVYVSRYFDYTLKYSNGLHPLEENETVKVIMFKCLPGKVFHVESLNMGMDPTPGHSAHSSPSHLEWYLFDERQLAPDYVVEIQAKLDTRTAADDE